MTKTFALEGSARGIRFNTITPGFIETDMTKDLPESAREAMLSRIALKRFASPKEVAGVVAFLLSDLSSYVTGDTIKVNGGLYL
jgi:3-oxoacyl-[acyl-carrier protein] reductase